MSSASTAANDTRALIRLVDLSPKLQCGFRNGPKAAGYQNARSMLFGLCLFAMLRGFTFAALINSFDTGSLRLHIIAREDVAGGRRRVEKYLLGLWEAAERRLGQHGGPIAVTEELVEVRHVVETFPLPGRGGPSERAVLLAVVNAGIAQTSRTPAISRVELALATGRSDSTVEATLDRLRRKGLLQQVEQGDVDRRSRWQLTLPEAPMAPNRGALVETTGGTTTHPDLVPSPDDDVWTGRASLSLVSWEVLRLLATSGGHTPVAASSALGRHPAVMRKHLNRLAELGLVVRDSDGVWSAELDAQALDLAARQLGVHGSGERHEQQILARAAARRDWHDQRDQAVQDKNDFARVRAAFYNEGPNARRSVPEHGERGLRFVVLAHEPAPFTMADWKAAGRPHDFRKLLTHDQQAQPAPS